MGAGISAFSQFEDEKEYLYAPLTHIELVGQTRVEQSEGRDLSVHEDGGAGGANAHQFPRALVVEPRERGVSFRAMRVWIDLVKCAGRHVRACMSVLAFKGGVWL